MQMENMMVKVPVQSFGDIITNSSSETFCTITSDDYLDSIYAALKAIIGPDGYSEDNISVDKIVDEDSGEVYLDVSVPYDASNYSNLIGAGIRAILDEGFKDKYNIEFI